MTGILWAIFVGAVAAVGAALIVLDLMALLLMVRVVYEVLVCDRPTTDR
jgi:hypothetical protein